ncbi:hypothetical protein QQF64_006093 [Cirrhinus molitorella]|uniref:Uncharacterized protein n=1 Tax=Cirrhinus molitorella TaxID=172907 RepID=A0ABR3MH79_9TELE
MPATALQRMSGKSHVKNLTTTDSGSNMIKALQRKNWTNLRCFRHGLHSAIDDGKSPGAGESNHTSPGSRQKTQHLVPTWQDIMVLESVKTALKPLQDFRDALSGEAGEIQDHVHVKLKNIKGRAASETEALLVENTALVESSHAEDQPEREREAVTTPLPSAKKYKKSHGSFL